jgi:hypothetical protein
MIRSRHRGARQIVGGRVVACPVLRRHSLIDFRIPQVVIRAVYFARHLAIALFSVIETVLRQRDPERRDVMTQALEQYLSASMNVGPPLCGCLTSPASVSLCSF